MEAQVQSIRSKRKTRPNNIKSKDETIKCDIFNLIILDNIHETTK